MEFNRFSGIFRDLKGLSGIFRDCHTFSKIFRDSYMYFHVFSRFPELRGLTYFQVFSGFSIGQALGQAVGQPIIAI